MRRRSLALTEDDRFEPEYAEVYGVPFSFIPCSGSSAQPKRPKSVTRVRALDERASLEMRFPRLQGYRYDLPADRLTPKFSEESRYVLTTRDIPTTTESAPIVGESSLHTLDDLKKRRPQEMEFRVARLTLEKFFRDDQNAVKHWLFPKLLAIVRRWVREGYVVCKDDTFPQMLLWAQFAHEAAERIYRSTVAGESGEKTLKPILFPYDPEGSTCHVDFDTTRATYPTNAGRCHISHVVADTGSWEQKLAQSLEDMDEVECYFKNQNVGFKIPYTANGEEHNYLPDFVARVRASHGALNLILEVTGQKDKAKEAKVSTAASLWVPAVNNHGGFGRWAYLEVRDPWDAKHQNPGLSGRCRMSDIWSAEACFRFSEPKLASAGAGPTPRAASELAATQSGSRLPHAKEHSKWHHGPEHRLGGRGAYMVTAGTYQKAHFFQATNSLDFLRDQLLELAEKYDWNLQAWAVFSNHYHFVALAPADANTLKAFTQHLHSVTAREINRQDGAPGRKIWHLYWDTQLTYEKSYLARLNYVHNNAIHHGLAAVATAYPWCSAAWFERSATPAVQKLVGGFRYDKVNVEDDFQFGVR